MAQIILSLTSPAVAVVIALWGFKRHDRTTSLRMLFEVQERYLAQRVRYGRKLIHTKLASERGLQECTPEELSTIGYALAVMNSIALCAESGQIDTELLRKSMGRSFAQAVAAAGPYFDYVEILRGFQVYPYARRLARRFETSDKLRGLKRSGASLSSPSAPEMQAATMPTVMAECNAERE